MRVIPLPTGEVRIFKDLSALSQAAAQEFRRAAIEASRARQRFTVALAGGSTPKAMFKLLTADHQAGKNGIPWEQAEVFFGDERHVPSTDSESNYRMASDTLLSRVPIPPPRIYRVQTELDPTTAAAKYEKEIREVFSASLGMPRFDLILLGMGPDGHTASLFPDTKALNENSALVVANWVAKLERHRITFTFPLINAAAEVLFVAGGADKATMLRNVLRGDPSGQTYPAQRIRPADGRLVWMVDETAAQML